MGRGILRSKKCGQHRRPVWLSLPILVGAIALLSPLSGSPAHAAEPLIRVYDPVLSLTGDCSVSTEDPIADPSCPGGSHPPKRFFNACGVATDSYGDTYVASSATGINEAASKGGRIDVFSPQGEYLTEIKDERQPCNIAVDSAGNLYVTHLAGRAFEDEFGSQTEYQLSLYAPTSYPPQAGAKYEPPVVVERNKKSVGQAKAIAIDPANDHLYAALSFRGIVEFGSAAENLPGEDWTPLREGIGQGLEGVALTGGFDVYGKNGNIYAAGQHVPNQNKPQDQRIYVINGTTNAKLCESDGSGTPAGRFSFAFGDAAIAVDQASGDFYVDDTQVNKVVDRFDSSCTYLDQLPAKPPSLQPPNGRPGLAVDAPCIGEGGASCDLGGYHSPPASEGNVYVGSGNTESNSHLFAFPLRAVGPPESRSQTAADITDTDAILHAEINPHALATTFRFEYIRASDYQADGGKYGAGSTSVPAVAKSAGQGASFIAVSQPAGGLEPDTAYRFRLVAVNCTAPGAIQGDCLTKGEGVPGGEGEDGTFATYPTEADGLPDGRGYELVTPPETGGYVPTMNELGGAYLGAATNMATNFALADGRAVLFGIEGGSLAGQPGNGFHDTYEAHREAIGKYGRWQSGSNGPDGTQAWHPSPAGFSADHSIAFWSLPDDEGASIAEGTYIRRADGVLDPKCSPDPSSDLELIGCGSLRTDREASGRWVSPDDGHIIFSTETENARIAQQLESQAAPTGTDAIYDRTPDGIAHVISLKPDGGSFGAGEDASYQGASVDGTAVAFTVSKKLYVRLDNAKTIEAAEGGPSFGGLSAHGGRIFYLRPNASKPLLPGSQIPQGEIFACDVRTAPCAGPGAQPPIQIGAGEESVLVNVSADGSRVYFVSPKVLDDAEEGTEGEENLYAWNGSGIALVADLDPGDVLGREILSNQHAGGLGLWVTNVVAPSPGARQGPANDPSRTTPNGAVLVFESRAELTDYDPNGHSEVYRYDSGAPPSTRLTCLSCNPTGAAAASDSQLEPDPPAQFASLPPVNAIASLANISENGKRVFFHSAERLVLGDTDGKVDVYEWETNGEGDCARARGCIRLISSGHSAGDDYLYAMTPSGNDVFFETGDQLVARDAEAAPSIYDARVDGGEAPEPGSPEPCLGEACQPLAGGPEDSDPASASFEGPGNVSPPRRCRARNKRHHSAGAKHARKRPKHCRAHTRRKTSR